MKEQILTLKNGIRVLHKSYSSAITHCCLVIQIGSRDEMVHEYGLAHFIEHMLFKETSKRNTTEILGYLEDVGGDINAYTTKEYICLHTSFLNEHLEKAIDLLTDIAFNSNFPEKEIKKEKNVILDEINTYLDQPEEAIYDDFEDLLFKNTPLGHNILGTTKTVKKFNREHIINFIDRNYSNQQMAWGIYGDIKTETLTELLNRYVEPLSFNKNKPINNVPNNHQSTLLTIKKPLTQSHCLIGNRAYSLHDDKRTGLLLLNNLLGGSGMSSKLNLEIREKKGIAYNIESNYVPFSDSGIFSIYLATDKNKLPKAISLVHKELKKLKEKRLTADELDLAKQKLKGLIALGEENRLGLLIAMTKSMLDYDRIDSIKEVFKKIDKVTASDLLAIANEIFDTTKLSTLIYDPITNS